MNWQKSSHSSSNGGECVEAASGGGLVIVRDTANRDGGALSFTAGAWQEFLGGLK